MPIERYPRLRRLARVAPVARYRRDRLELDLEFGQLPIPFHRTSTPEARVTVPCAAIRGTARQ